MIKILLKEIVYMWKKKNKLNIYKYLRLLIAYTVEFSNILIKWAKSKNKKEIISILDNKDDLLYFSQIIV